MFGAPPGKPDIVPVAAGKPDVVPVAAGKQDKVPVAAGKPDVVPVAAGKPANVPAGKPAELPVGKPAELPVGKPAQVPDDKGKPAITPVAVGKLEDHDGPMSRAPRKEELNPHAAAVCPELPAEIKKIVDANEEVNDQEKALNDLLIEKKIEGGKDIKVIPPHNTNDSIQDEINRLAAECFAGDALEDHDGVNAIRGGFNYFGDSDSSSNYC